MMKRRLQYLGLFTLLLVIVVTSVSVAGSTKPDADFIARAMEQQELNCGASLEVRYTVTHPAVGSIVKTIEDVHYIRTRNVLFVNIDRSGDCTSCIKQRYDRVSRETRRLADAGAGKKKNGLISTTGLDTGIGACTCQDPITLPLRIGPLYQAVRQGVVAAEQEEIDGHLCWRVDIPERVTGYKTRQSWSIWVDPDIGLCPRRVKNVFTNEEDAKRSNVTVRDFLDYKSLGNGTFFPMGQRITPDGVVPKDGSEPQICVKEVKCGREIAAEELAVEFPSGTDVHVSPLNASYVEP